MEQYNINPASRCVNNICESIFNGGQQYIQPKPVYTPQPPPQTSYTPPTPIHVPHHPIPTYKPINFGTPDCLKGPAWTR